MKKLNVFKHYILTKFNTMPDDSGKMLYDKKGHNEWMDYRMEVFEGTKKSVLSQVGDFMWIISLDERTPKKYVDKIKTDKRIIITPNDIREVFLTKEVKITTPWIITTRLDNDDRYLPGAIHAIQSRFEKKLKVIDIMFQKLDYKTGVLKDPVWKWDNSPFISLCEPAKRVLTAFCRPHGQVAGEYPTGKLTGTYPAAKDRMKIDSEVIQEFFAHQVCHDRNITNKM